MIRQIPDGFIQELNFSLRFEYNPGYAEKMTLCSKDTLTMENAVCVFHSEAHKGCEWTGTPHQQMWDWKREQVASHLGNPLFLFHCDINPL